MCSSARTVKDATLGNVARGLWILLVSVGLVLLIACANVANMFLVRSEARRREVAVRMEDQRRPPHRRDQGRLGLEGGYARARFFQ